MNKTRKPGSCPIGYHHRKGYTIKRTGTRVAESCVKSTFGTLRKSQKKSHSRRGIKTCQRGKILRSPYVRIQKDKRIFIPASCIDDVGNPGKGFTSSSDSTDTGIGPLRKGDLARFGYKTVTAMSESRRHLALRAAVQEYGSLTVWRKLNAVYIYTRHTSPESSAIFLADRDWVRFTFGISAI